MTLNKKKINSIMANMPHNEFRELSDFTGEEREHIINVIANQKYKYNFQFELNGVSTDPTTHTRFRKLINKF